MVFRAKVDRYFVLLFVLVVLAVALAIFFPLWLDDAADALDVRLMALFFQLTAGFLFWCCFSVKYEFREDHLFVKGGPFRSRIPYGQIRKVTPTRDIFTGYRLLSSFDALEIFYDRALLGSVKISPRDQEAFLAELKKRCPHVRIEK